MINILEGSLLLSAEEGMSHYHVGDRGIACEAPDCSDLHKYKNPDRQRKCAVCGLEKWSREEFPFLDSACNSCGPEACARGDHNPDFDVIGRGAVTTFSCMRCDWTSRDAVKGFGLMGAVPVPDPKKNDP